MPGRRRLAGSLLRGSSDLLGLRMQLSDRLPLPEAVVRGLLHSRAETALRLDELSLRRRDAAQVRSGFPICRAELFQSIRRRSMPG